MVDTGTRPGSFPRGSGSALEDTGTGPGPQPHWSSSVRETQEPGLVPALRGHSLV